MCIFINVCVYIYIYIYMYIYIYVHVYKHIYICIYTYMCLYTYILYMLCISHICINEKDQPTIRNFIMNITAKTRYIYMCIYMYIYIHIYIYTHTNVYICIYIWYIYICTYMYSYIYIQMYMYITYIHMYIYVYITYEYIYKYTHIYIQIYIYMRKTHLPSETSSWSSPPKLDSPSHCSKQSLSHCAPHFSCTQKTHSKRNVWMRTLFFGWWWQCVSITNSTLHHTVLNNLYHTAPYTFLTPQENTQQKMSECKYCFLLKIRIYT